jgi:hypothetical protein
MIQSEYPVYPQKKKSEYPVGDGWFPTRIQITSEAKYLVVGNIVRQLWNRLQNLLTQISKYIHFSNIVTLYVFLLIVH